MKRLPKIFTTTEHKVWRNSQPTSHENNRQHKNNFYNFIMPKCLQCVAQHIYYATVTKFATARTVATVLTMVKNTGETHHAWITVERTAKKCLKLLIQCMAGPEAVKLLNVCVHLDNVSRLALQMWKVPAHFHWLPHEQEALSPWGTALPLPRMSSCIQINNEHLDLPKVV